MSVTDSAGLAAALADPTAHDIVLAAGTYDNAAPFENPFGHRLYAATLGSAVLQAGLVIGSNYAPPGAVVQGIAFDVSDPSKTFLDSIIHVWGAAKGTRILDTTFAGHRAVGTALMVRQPDGLVVQRVRVRDFRVDGILVDANVLGLTLTTRVLLEDLDVANVSFDVPGGSNGTAEACVWLGNTSVLRRALLRNCAWTGLWTGTAGEGSIHEDLDIDNAGAGVYIEHFSTGATFQRMHIGSGVWTGVACEWADPAWSSRPACDGNVIQDSTISSASVGVLLDYGTARTTIRRVMFVGVSSAAVIDRQGVDNTYTDNDFSRIAPGSVAVAY